MKTKIVHYVNKRNPNKFIEVHYDGYGHRTVRGYMFWRMNKVKNMLGDRCLHRWRIGHFKDLLGDYREAVR